VQPSFCATGEEKRGLEPGENALLKKSQVERGLLSVEGKEKSGRLFYLLLEFAALSGNKGRRFRRTPRIGKKKLKLVEQLPRGKGGEG